MHNEYYKPDPRPDPRQVRLQSDLARFERSVDGEAIHKLSNDRRSQYAMEMNVGDLTEFDPHDPRDYPTVAGIYVLYDVSDRPLYIGQGGSIDKRLRSHRDKFWFKSPIVESASYVRIDNKSLRERVEAILIRFLKSHAVINRKLVDR
jgi:hypothetical protein